MKKEVLHCNFCNDTSYVRPYPNHDTLVKCARCGLIYSRIQMTRKGMENFYTEAYFASANSGERGYDSYLKSKDAIIKTFKRRMDMIERYIKTPGRVLDVGCAAGFFLQVARERGWQACGIDISDYCISHARNELKLDARRGLLADLDFSDSYFDLVTMWDYLEHSITPREDIIKAHGLLKKGGLLVIATPDIDALPARLYKGNWIGIKLEEHFFYFSKHLLRDLLSKTGFEVLKDSYIGKYISAGLFFDRLKFYNNFLFKLGNCFSRANLFQRLNFYCNPFDIIFVISKKI